jgi:hypothetical protein
MDMWAILVDWEQASQRAAAGRLADDLVAELGESPWLQDAGFEGTFEEYTSMGSVYEALRPHAPPPLAGALSASLDRFVREEPEPWNELPEALDPENHFLAISPATAASIASSLQEVDVDALGRLCASHCPEEKLEDLEYSPAQFVESVNAWADLFGTAKERGWGVIVKVG